MWDFQCNLAAARGEVPADLLIQNVSLVNVLSGEVHGADVAIFGGYFLGFGDYEAREVVDAKGLFMSPGFIDGHIHFESTMLSLHEFSRALLLRGATAAVIDPHEIANVFGMDGIRYVLHAIEEVALDVFVMLPSCVPATHLETSGATLSHADLETVIGEKRVVGIGEVMNYPMVIEGDEETHRKIRVAGSFRVDGHAPGVSGRDLNAYVFSNIDSDHESVSAKEAREKLRKGMHILVREGTSERNLADIVPIITRENSRNFSFATDDKHPDDLLREGHLDYSIKKAISLGLDPMIAYQMATINTASHYRLNRIGAVKPGYQADFLLLSDLENVAIKAVYKKGKVVSQGNEMRSVSPATRLDMPGAMHPKEFSSWQLAVPATGKKIRVIDIVAGQIVTEEYVTTPTVKDNMVVSDTARDILKIVVIERHKATGNIGKGFVRGLGLQSGAIGSTVAHDSHNIVIAGTSDEEIYSVFERLRSTKGGLVAMDKGTVVAELPLPIGGLLSTKTFEEVAADYNNLKHELKQFGCRHDSPFMILSFLSLSPIPKLKITDLGLIDVERFEVTPLFVE